MGRIPCLLLLCLAWACHGDGGAKTASDVAAEVGGETDAATPVDAGGDSGGEPDAVETDVGPPPELVIEDPRDLVGYVDPMIGTRGSGNALPGALVPHGMVRAGPDTFSEEATIGSYEYHESHIVGFTHTGLEGPGGSGYGYSQILFMPTVGALKTELIDYKATFSHDSEAASPGYYAVTLEDYGVHVELTATGHAAVHRYTFPASDEARVLIDLGPSGGTAIDSRAEVLDERRIAGYGAYNVHPLINAALGEDEPTGLARVYFHAEFSRPFDGAGTWQGLTPPRAVRPGDPATTGQGVGAWVDYQTVAGAVIEVRVGISFIDEQQAAANAAAEIGEATFDEVHAGARERWNLALNRVQVDGDEDFKRVFYTALYHSLFQPADYSEAGGRFHSAAGGTHEVFESSDRRFYTDDWCMWDTFRTSHPLGTLIEPELRSDIVWSMLHLYQQGGWLPKCTWHATGYSRVMIGNHAVPIIADAFVKGLRDYDLELAWEAVYKAAMQDNPNILEAAACGYFNLGTVPQYIELGYVPSECDPTQSVSMTLEYAYNDWTTALIADGLAKAAERDALLARAESWRAHWDDGVGFMRAKLADGSWVEPFDPTNDADMNDFCEADSWIYSFFVPHDVLGLIEVMGGEQAFVERLDAFFDDGHFDPSNQPSFHIPWLYNYAGAPAKTQARVRDVLAEEYSSQPGGLPGNDDAGSTSAWFVLGALGLYPVAPGEPVYQLGAPLVDQAVLHLHPAHYDGGAFTIRTENGGLGARYVQSATLNGQPLDRPWITHDELVAGGELVFVLGTEPSAWGSN